ARALEVLRPDRQRLGARRTHARVATRGGRRARLVASRRAAPPTTVVIPCPLTAPFLRERQVHAPCFSDPTGTRARGAGDALAIGDVAVASGVAPGPAAGRRAT